MTINTSLQVFLHSHGLVKNNVKKARLWHHTLDNNRIHYYKLMLCAPSTMPTVLTFSWPREWGCNLDKASHNNPFMPSHFMTVVAVLEIVVDHNSPIPTHIIQVLHSHIHVVDPHFKILNVSHSINKVSFHFSACPLWEKNPPSPRPTKRGGMDSSNFSLWYRTHVNILLKDDR